METENRGENGNCPRTPRGESFKEEGAGKSSVSPGRNPLVGTISVLNMDKAGLPQAKRQVGRQQVGGLLQKTACEGEEGRRDLAGVLERGGGRFKGRAALASEVWRAGLQGTARQGTGEPGAGTPASVRGQDRGARRQGGTGRSLRGIFQQSISWLGEGLTSPRPHICPQTNEIPGLPPGRGRTRRETADLS